jgi:hypothetical protein
MVKLQGKGIEILADLCLRVVALRIGKVAAY